MLQNDPLLQALMGRLALTPFGVALLSVLLFWAILPLFCWRAQTLRMTPNHGNPNAHGLLSLVNLYILLIPFLNFTIFRYYEVYAETITQLCQTRVLTVPAAAVFSALKTSDAVRDTILSFILSMTLAVASIVWNANARRKKTNWLCLNGSPRLVSWYFHLLFFFVELAIIFNWALRHVRIWRRINELLANAQPIMFHPDRMFGWHLLSNLSAWSFIVMSLIALLVAVWLLGTRLALQSNTLYRNPGHLLATLAVIVVGPAAVLIPLRVAHHQMQETKEAQLQRIAIDLSTIDSSIAAALQTTPGAEQPIKNLQQARQAGQQLYDAVEATSTWPISTSTLGTLPLGFLSPLLLPLAIDAGKKLLGKAWAAP